MPLTLSSIRKKARKTQDPYTTDEVLNTWQYLEILEQNPQLDSSLNDLTAAERTNRISSTKQSIKNVEQVRLQELMTADLSRYTAGELDTLRCFLGYVSSSDLNEALLPRIEAQEKVLQEEPEQLHSIQNEAPVEEATATETEVEAQNDDVINETIIDGPQSPVAPPPKKTTLRRQKQTPDLPVLIWTITAPDLLITIKKKAHHLQARLLLASLKKIKTMTKMNTRKMKS